MATDPLDLRDDFHAVVARTRREVVAAGEHKAGLGDPVTSLGIEERQAILRLLRDGTYAEAVARIGEQDPDLADQ